jgi:hypothetical protein
MAIRTLFAGDSISVHLLRGAIGIPSLYCVSELLKPQTAEGLAGATVFGIIAIVAMRGCPTCWIVGLFNILMNRVSPIPEKAEKVTQK